MTHFPETEVETDSQKRFWNFLLDSDNASERGFESQLRISSTPWVNAEIRAIIDQPETNQS